MSSKALIPLVVGCAVGLFAIKMVVDVVQKAKGVQGGNLVPVVVASREIAAYEAVHPDMLRTTQIPKDAMLEGGFATPEALEGRVAAVPIYRGMTVVDTMLTEPGTIPGITAVIRAGYRAVSVKVDEETGGAGFVKPGHRVDVATVMNVKRGNKTETVSRVILQNVAVVAVGQELTASDGVEATLSRSITLAVKAEDVAKLHLAATRGKIRLAIRNNVDEQSSRHLASTTQGQVLGEEEADDQGQQQGSLSLLSLFKGGKESQTAPVRLAAAANQPWSVVVTNGDRTEIIHFRDSQSMQKVGGTGVFKTTAGGESAAGFGQAWNTPADVGDFGRDDVPGADVDPEPAEETE